MSKSKTAAQAEPEYAAPTVPANLAEALVLAQSSIDRVAKSSANSFHKYAYTSADTMIAATRSALAVAGLAVRRESWSITADERYVESVFAIMYGPTGETRTDRVAWPIVAEKGRPVDKALAGALTTSLSYWLRDLLLLPRDDDAEMDRRDDRRSDDTTSRGLGHRPPARRDLSRITAMAADAARTPPAASEPQASPKGGDAPEAATRELRGILAAVTSRSVNGQVWQIATIGETDCVVATSVGDDVGHYRGANVVATVSDRAGRMPILHDFQVLERSDASSNSEGGTNELF